ncbi:Glucosamine-phosphate N-acetyltransferase-like protein [Conoideocrella luteorostrata]|uniref:Glucosamine 6-phosphate N-acetyltransferase n=1 Tax=Conoideocrella luteorostrata TaxID=1105319 RepID=A0AAJ0CRB2_9HYPO|nr:Glucosamine-phosphate N-acetyltransferase-like protein [Conoideocrella luteorostrata]
MATEEGLFSQNLVSEAVSEKLPEGYKLRALRETDFDTGFLECLRVLTTVGDITKEQFAEQFKKMKRQQDYYIIVIEDTNRTEGENSVVATGALIVEHKFIHSLGAVGHIEDIAVAKDQQGKKLGLRLIQALDHVAEKVGCYKCILDCSDANEGFYVKCGFRRAGLQMAHYYQGSKSKPQ